MKYQFIAMCGVFSCLTGCSPKMVQLFQKELPLIEKAEEDIIQFELPPPLELPQKQFSYGFRIGKMIC